MASGRRLLRPAPDLRQDRALLEAHLFDFDGDLYGRNLRVALVEFVRPDVRFDDLAALVAQMDEDARAARRLLAQYRVRRGQSVTIDYKPPFSCRAPTSR